MYNRFLWALLVFSSVLFNTALAQNKYPSILWEIKKTPASKPSYLFGTYHISSKGVFKLGDSLFYALKNADMVCTEINDNTWQAEDEALDKMKNNYSLFNTYYNGSFIHEGVLRKTNTIQKLPVFISFQPAAINYFLYRNTEGKENFEEEAYLDMFLSSAGYKLGKKIAGLENIIESEIKEIEGSKDEELLEKEENKELPDGMSEDEINDQIFDGYKNNSLDIMDSLEKYTYSSEAYYKKFITARNYDQADSLDYYIRQGNSIFAAVGSAHLPGKEGVIAIMQKKGYKVRPVKLKGHDKAEIEAIKKITVPVTLSPRKTGEEFSYLAPGELAPSFSNSLLRIYSYVDMANGGYYLLSRACNNSFYFGKKEKEVMEAIDSLLYENIKGEIISKNKLIYDGYPALDLLSLVNNKDYERYRFIVTPYEILKIKVGGRNGYVKMPVIDSFFNSFVIHQEAPIPAADGISVQKNTNNWHRWQSDYLSKPLAKIRYSNYDKITQSINGCIKISLINQRLQPDDDYYKLAAESFTSSFALQKGENKKSDFSKISGPAVTVYALEQGGAIAVKPIIKQPFLYLLYTATMGTAAPDTSWMQSFTAIDPNAPADYTYTDSLKAISVKLPYPLNFDAKWKAARERKVKKPDPGKKPNRDEALLYQNKNIYYKGEWDSYTFQDPQSLDLIWGSTCTLDTNYYYPFALSFWKNFIPQPFNAEDKNKPSLPGSPDYSVLFDEKISRYELTKSSGYITRLLYDTANPAIQRISYIRADSFSKKAVFNTYILKNNKVYEFQTPVAAPGYELPSFFENVINSFKPFNNDKPFNVYRHKLNALVKAYKKAAIMEKSDLAEDLNYYHFDVKDLPDIDKAIAAVNTRAPEDNILRKKLIEAVGKMDDKKTHWPEVSNWLKKIYHNENELLTIRLFALQQILSAHDETDLDWVMENLDNNIDFKSSVVREGLLRYFSGINNKETAKTKLSLPHFGTGPNIYYAALPLYDSGYFTASGMKAAFAEINKLVADEKSSFQLKAEGDLFKYPEKSEKKDVSDLQYDNNFIFFTSMFTLFYSAIPDDPYFEENYKKIAAGGTPKDKLQLLKVFVKQKDPPLAWINELLQSLTPEKNLYLDIFKVFLYYKKENLLPASFRDKTDIARAFLKLNETNYNQIDTIYHYGARVSPYAKGETFYFFKYRRKDEQNEQIGYVIFPEDLSILLTKEKVKYKLTKEQVSADETFESVTDKLMHKHYINYLYDTDGDVDFYLDEKDEKSIDIEE